MLDAASVEPTTPTGAGSRRPPTVPRDRTPTQGPEGSSGSSRFQPTQFPVWIIACTIQSLQSQVYGNEHFGQRRGLLDRDELGQRDLERARDPVEIRERRRSLRALDL